MRSEFTGSHGIRNGKGILTDTFLQKINFDSTIDLIKI